VYEAIFVALGTLIPTIAGAIVLIITTVHKNRQEAARQKQEQGVTAVSDYKALFDRLEGQVNRQDRVIEGQGKVITELYALHAESEISHAESFAMSIRLYDHCVALASILKRLGHEIDPLPPAPTPRKSTLPQSEFLLRTSEQSKILVRPPLPTGGSGI
jgi:hypothetical protein